MHGPMNLRFNTSQNVQIKITAKDWMEYFR